MMRAAFQLYYSFSMQKYLSAVCVIYAVVASFYSTNNSLVFVGKTDLFS